MKVLGCKVSDETYERFIELGRPISDSLRDAISQYLNRLNHSQKSRLTTQKPRLTIEKQICI